MDDQGLEQNLNNVIDDLYQGLLSVAASVRQGSRDEIADKIEAMAGIICEHWPNCFAQKKSKGY